MDAYRWKSMTRIGRRIVLELDMGVFSVFQKKELLKEITNMAHNTQACMMSTLVLVTGLITCFRHVPLHSRFMLRSVILLGLDTIELNAELFGVSEDTLLRYIRLVNTGGLRAKPQFSVKFNKSDIPAGRDRAFGAYVFPAPRSSEVVEDVDFMIRRCLEAGAEMVMVDAKDICKHPDSMRADIIAKIVGRLGLEKTMFEACDARTSLMVHQAIWSNECFYLQS